MFKNRLRAPNVSCSIPSHVRSFSVLGVACCALFVTIDVAAVSRRTTVTTLLKKEKSLLSQLESTTQYIQTLQQQITQTQQQLNLAQRTLDELSRRIATTEQRLQPQRQTLAHRLRLQHHLSRGGIARLVIEDAKGSDQYWYRWSMQQYLLRKNQRELQIFEKEQQQLSGQKQILQQHQKRLQALLRSQQLKEVALTNARQRHRQQLVELTQDRKQNQRLQTELTHLQRKLLAQISQLKKSLQKPDQTSPQSLHWPVTGHYSAPNNSLPGIVITPVRTQTIAHAAASGTVQLSQPIEGLGHVVIIAHQDNLVSVYGFLARATVTVGQSVATAAPIGEIGQSPFNGKKSLYFELRNGANILNPVVWLRTKH